MRLSLLSAAATATAALALAALCGCSSNDRTAGSTATFQGAGFPAGLVAPPFTLTDQRGARVSSSRYAGRVSVVAFIPRGSRVGVLVAQQVRGALDQLGGAAAGVAVLLIGTRATPAQARAAAAQLLRDTGLTGRGVRYLTGPPRRLRAVWHAYGLPPASAGERAYLSSTPVILVDRAGRERVGFPVEELTPEGLAHDLRALFAESPNGVARPRAARRHR